MSTIDQRILDKFANLLHEYSVTKDHLKNLEDIKSTITEERFLSQQKAHEEKINQLLPEIESLKNSIEEALKETELKFEELDTALNKKNEELEQEKLMFDSRAISHEQFKENTSKLKKEQKAILAQHKKTASQLTALKNALSGETYKKSSKKFFNGNQSPDSISPESDSPDINSPPESSFAGDFSKGCFVIILIAILIPVVGLFFTSVKGIALIFIPILAFVIIVAFFGKILNYLKKIW